MPLSRVIALLEGTAVDIADPRLARGNATGFVPAMSLHPIYECRDRIGAAGEELPSDSQRC